MVIQFLNYQYFVGMLQVFLISKIQDFLLNSGFYVVESLPQNADFGRFYSLSDLLSVCLKTWPFNF